TVPFDVAVVAEARVPVRDIRRVIEGVAGEALLDARVLSVYDEVGEGKKSVAFHLVFGSGERTLSGEEVSALQTRVVGALEQQGYRLR
ncbi:MAG: phenylalanine--tRNA ligase subunit beta, partial [Planctomycetes bacterium]|nr:phenylalanine--tRNA ligase subunit beta [Planctomycetota bacterium]